jgi:hypothetical protein
MAQIEPNPDMLTSKAEIKSFLHNCSDYLFNKYIKQGMPALYDDGRWSASAKRISAWWELRNNVSMKGLIDQIPVEESAQGVREQ